MTGASFSDLKARVIVAYALPGLPLAVLTLPVYVFIPTLYSRELGLELAAIGVVLLTTRVLDAFSDPIIGVLSDRTAGPWGRRKIWVVTATPLCAAAAYILFTPPEGAGANDLFIWSAALTLAWTAVLLPYSSWAAELTGDYNGRTTLTSVREAFVLTGTIVVMALPTGLTLLGYPSLRTHAQAIAWIVVGLLPVSVLLCAAVVPDRQPAGAARAAFRDGIRVLFNNRPFGRLVAAFVINGMANGLPATLFILFVSHRLAMPDAYGPLLLAYFLSGLAAIPFWHELSKRLGKHRTWVAAMVWSSAAFIWTPFVVGPGDWLAFSVITVLSGLGVGADLTIPASIQADVIDVDTLESGEQRTGLYFALWGVATKLALALAVGTAFPVLDAVGFEAAAAAGGNTENALFVLTLLYSFLPVVLKLTASGLMWTFPLTAERQREIRRTLEARGSVA